MSEGCRLGYAYHRRMTHAAGDSLWRTAAAITILVTATLVVLALGHIRAHRELLVSVARALVQLTAVALVIAWIFVHPGAGALYVAVMLAAATTTAARRIGCGWRHAGSILGSILAGASLTVFVVTLTGALAGDVQTVLPFTAQMIGGAMTAALLAGSRMRDDAIQRWDEVEGYLALGASPRQALVPIGRAAVQASLAPALDQTKSAGLVLLPGSFVGLLLGGASPATAAQVQLLVLVGLILAQAVASLLTTYLLAPTAATQKPTVWLMAR
jgi:UDP-glucose/iron transport system permease protein